MKTKQQRTQDIIERFRGLPGEFYMLKGLLVLPTAAGSNLAGDYETQRKEEKRVNAIYDGMAIAKRMDELNGIID